MIYKDVPINLLFPPAYYFQTQSIMNFFCIDLLITNYTSFRNKQQHHHTFNICIGARTQHEHNVIELLVSLCNHKEKTENLPIFDETKKIHAKKLIFVSPGLMMIKMNVIHSIISYDLKVQ